MSSIKDCFISRFDAGYVIEADFSQLEIIGLAILSGDPVLRDDLISGRDLHCVSASMLTGEKYETIREAYLAEDEYWTKKRKIAKVLSFQLQYGSGAGNMADSAGVSVDEAKDFIKGYYDRYREVKNFQDSVRETVENNRTCSNELKTDGGYPAGESEYVSITGRRYWFREYDAPRFLQKKGINTSFSPTQTKNYPVQGYATGDIVPEVLGRLWRELYKTGMYKSCLPMNTVHDSIIFDCKREALYDAGKLIKSVMEDAPQFMYERFGINIDLPFPVDIEYGDNWGNVTKLEID